MKKYSRQRELILNSLKDRIDHPTADMLYADLKEEMPEIGIATIYRNLSDLCEHGQVMKLKVKNGPDRFDGNVVPHIHFECNHCHEIYDIFIQENEAEKMDNEMQKIAKMINAQVEQANIWLEGFCQNCKNKKIG